MQPKPGGFETWFHVGLELSNWYQELSQIVAGVSDGHSATWPPHQVTYLRMNCGFILTLVFNTELLLPGMGTSSAATVSWTSVVPLFVSLSFSMVSFNAPRYIGMMGSYSGNAAIHHSVKCKTEMCQNENIYAEYNQMYSFNQNF